MAEDPPLDSSCAKGLIVYPMMLLFISPDFEYLSAASFLHQHFASTDPKSLHDRQRRNSKSIVNIPSQSVQYQVLTIPSQVR